MAAFEASLDYLARTDRGCLAVCGVPAAELLATYSSPLLVYVPHRVKSNIDNLRGAFTSRASNNVTEVRLHYALKACYLRPVVSTALAAGAGLEVMSDLELQIASLSGVRGLRLVTNGLGRSLPYAQRCAADSEALHVIDTREDLHTLANLAREAGVVLNVAVRLASRTHLDQSMSSDSKLGYLPEELDALIEQVDQYACFRLVGLHGHRFTHAHNPSDYERHVAEIASYAAYQERHHQRRFKVIDIGGGLDTAGALTARKLGVATFADAAARALQQVPYPFVLALEPGRFAVADAAIGLTCVKAQKQRGGFIWKIIDLSTNTLIPVAGMSYPAIAETIQKGTPMLSKIADGACTDTTICADLMIPHEASALAILDCGAYTTVFAHLWGPNPPQVITITPEGQTMHIIGHRQWAEAAKSIYGYELSL